MEQNIPVISHQTTQDKIHNSQNMRNIQKKINLSPQINSENKIACQNFNEKNFWTDEKLCNLNFNDNEDKNKGFKSIQSATATKKDAINFNINTINNFEDTKEMNSTHDKIYKDYNEYNHHEGNNIMKKNITQFL